jgi:hypothetical protein
MPRGINSNIAMDMVDDDIEFRFQLLPVFTAKTLEFSNEELFPPKSETSLTTGYATWHLLPNQYIDNEVRGFIQHLVVGKKLSASYVKDFFVNWCKSFSGFINDRHSEMTSIVNYDHQKLLAEYIIWLSDNGYQTYTKRQLSQLTKDMDWLVFNTKSMHLYAYTMFYRYIESLPIPATTKLDELENKLASIFTTLLINQKEVDKLSEMQSLIITLLSR